MIFTVWIALTLSEQKRNLILTKNIGKWRLSMLFEVIKISAKILEFNWYLKSDSKSHILYRDLQSLIKRIDGCKNNSEKSSTTKIGDHTPGRYSMSIIWAFDGTKISMMYTEVKMYEKVSLIFKRARNGNN